MTEIFTLANSYEALPKIFEVDEEVFEVKKKHRDGNISSKNRRSKRRKANAKEKNYRRKIGTKYSDNPYRGNPGDYMHEYRLYERGNRSEKEKRDERRIVSAEMHELFATEEIVDNVINLENNEEISLIECFVNGDWELFMILLENKYPKDKVIEVLKTLEEAE